MSFSFRSAAAARLVILAGAPLVCCGCTPSTDSVGANPANLPVLAQYADKDVHTEVLAEAKQLGIEDGWYFGEEPRVFKSPYGQAPPEIKADFAQDYQHMLNQSGQDMLKNWQSYVPYSKRSLFARKWWSDRSSDFTTQSPKMKVQWIHEALLDGAELWWRANEKLLKGNLSSPQELAHDAEQRLVFNWSESERQPSTFSDQPRPQ